MRNKTYRITLLFLLITSASACQILDRLAPSQAEPSVVVVPTLTPVGAGEVVSPEVTGQAQEEAAPTASPEDENAPPPLPATVPPQGGEDTAESAPFALFENPAGYRFQHPAEWDVADYFGQTIATNESSVLETGTLTEDQLLILFMAGPVAEDNQSAEQLLNSVQQDVLASYLAEGDLTILAAPTPLARGGAIGVEATYLLTTESDDENLHIQAFSLLKQELYVVVMALQPESGQAEGNAMLEEALQSVELTADRYLVDAATYGLTQEELDTLLQELVGSE